VAVITGIAHWVNPAEYHSPVVHVLSGGLLLGAFFMATDMVTSPMTKKGAWIFGLGCGIMTSLIRLWGSYPEGVSFSILFMNALVPLIDRTTIQKPFGYVAPEKGQVA
jgi:electron transport complex protein RnfD